ncbi:MAG: histidinol phosphate phosphatase [Erysipelotrichaceae bacterium]|nr:histidinol phosphate phosphatase [Erysipelotrichaceae bacterium]
MHLEYGELSAEYVLQFVGEAVLKGLDEIDILDHTHRFREFRECYDHLRIHQKQDEWLNGKTKFCSTLDEYDELITQIRDMDLPVRVRFGLEVCYTEDTELMLRDVLKDRHYDFLTGAVHSVNHILYDMPFSGELLWERFSADDIYRDYYKAVMACVSSGLFDRLAHPDTIKLFEIYPDYDLTETYRQLARLLKENNMMAENNTGCHYRYHHPDVGLSGQLLAVFKEEGVRIMTASDAHKPEHVGSYIREAAERSRT